MPDPEPALMFEDGSELPLFSGTPQSVAGERFEPREVGLQALLPGMPGVDLEHVYRRDNAARLGRQVVAYRLKRRDLSPPAIERSTCTAWPAPSAAP
jgi:hypothetical protein